MPDQPLWSVPLEDEELFVEITTIPSATDRERRIMVRASEVVLVEEYLYRTSEKSQALLPGVRVLLRNGNWVVGRQSYEAVIEAMGAGRGEGS